MKTIQKTFLQEMGRNVSPKVFQGKMKIDGDTNEILEYLVIDTGAVLRGETYSFSNIAKTICTITEVLNEIRDSKSRQLLEKLPYKIEIMTPSDKALKEVVAFCRKTGDFNALSLTDIKLIALVYTLESSLFGDSHLLQRSKEYQKLTSTMNKKDNITISQNVSHPITTSNDEIKSFSSMVSSTIEEEEEENDNDDNNNDDYDYDYDNDNEINKNEDQTQNLSSGAVSISQDSSDVINDLNITEKIEIDHIEINHHINQDDHELPKSNNTGPKTWANIVSSPSPAPSSSTVSTLPTTVDDIITDGKKPTNKSIDIPIDIKESKEPKRLPDKVISSRILNKNNISENTNQISESILNTNVIDDDGKGWIHIGNISSYRANGMTLDSSIRTKRINASFKVGCMTTDFSIQNVLLQFGLYVLSTDGLQVRRVKRWTLMCVACRATHSDLSRLFCSKCGSACLTRVACSIDADSGELRLHLRRNYRVDLRGTKYSLPRPGSPRGELLLREDQLLSGFWKQKVNAARREVRSSLAGDDFVESDVGLQINKLKIANITVGYGKKNPNAEKGRERRGKKKLR